MVAKTRTGADGRFVLEVPDAGSGTIRVYSEGFAVLDHEWDNEPGKEMLTFVLRPAMLSEKVVVAATRTESRVGETAASVSVVSARDLAATASVTVDDALRQVPGFQLFRRTSSRVANPTAQGVSLRGLGASGASRALVLADGIPLNDPFGGWVYWGRVPRESIERIEVLRGGASSLYGSGALGGAISIVTPDAESTAFSLSTSYGSQNTGEASFFGGTRWKGWGLALAAEGFRTDGYIPVEEPSRGPVDTAADSRRGTIDLRIDRAIGSDGRIFGKAAFFREKRGNGTPEQTNDTLIRQFGAGGNWNSDRLGTFDANIYGGTQTYDQTFSAIASDRASETLLRLQRVPSQVVGFSGQWSRAFGQIHTLVAGIEAREVRGSSDETVIQQNVATSLISGGGRERTFAVFGEDMLRISPKVLIIGKLRFDHWKNFAGLLNSRSLLNPSQVSVISFPDRTESAFSPQVSLLYQHSDRFSMFASGYKSFRAPTLNELYRSFRVGDILTRANENLKAERLTGAEAGILFNADRPNFEVRGTVFWSEVDRPVANLTLSITPDLITRQRQNLGKTRARGFEADVDFRPHDRIELTGGYLFVDSTVTDFPGNESLVGLMIPQVARHQVTFQARYVDPSTLSFSVQGRGNSRQFDDDRNMLPLNAYFTLDAMASKRINRHFEAFIAAENLLNQRYEAGRTTVTTIGPPFAFRTGVRVRFGAQ